MKDLYIHPYWLIAGSAAFALIPAGLAMVTSYMKVSIVLSMIRNGLGTPQVPSGTVIMALSTALTAWIMAPVAGQSYGIMQDLPAPDLRGPPSFQDYGRYLTALRPWKDFMRLHGGSREKEFFLSLGQDSGKMAPADPGVRTLNEDDLRIILPAFILSELKESFAMAFAVMLPFLVIDLVVANILTGLGMYMVSPVMISLPLKLMLFVISDAWLLLARGLVQSYAIQQG